MKYDLWEPKRRIELEYQRALHQVLKKIQRYVNYVGEPQEVANIFKKVANSAEFNRYAQETANRMVTHLFTDAGRTWRTAARENSQGRMIYETLKRELQGPVGGSVIHQIQRNAEIIKSVPLTIARDMTDYIAQETVNGRRSESILADLLELVPDISLNKAKLIARTEVGKTSTALTRARSDNLGLDWYIWRTSKDSRVRDSHDLMEGVMVSWRDPPSPELLNGEKNAPKPYHPGEIYNCRCYPEPVVTLDLVQWPRKVYRNGTITMMTRVQFQSITA